MIYLQLFYTFFKIGLLGFGGGYGILSLIQFDIVEQHKWLSIREFTDIVAISQATPGPIGINSATFVGYSVAGIGGALVSSIAVVLPSFILMYILINIFSKYHESKYAKSILNIMQYIVIGLISSAALLMVNEETFGEGMSDIVAWIILLTASFMMLKFKTSPILLIIAGAVFGIIFL